MYNIRHADSTDAEYIKENAIRFMEYYPVKVDYDLDVLMQVVGNVAATGIFLMVEEDGVPAGFVGGMVSPYPYAPMHLVATEMFLWVDEEHRKTGAAQELIKAFEFEAEYNNCKYVSMCSTVHTPYFNKHLKSIGYKEVETAFIKEV